jgi:hypothetical protein
MQTNYKAFSSGRGSNLKKKQYTNIHIQSPLNQSSSAFYKKTEHLRHFSIGIPNAIMDKGQTSIDSFNVGSQHVG